MEDDGQVLIAQEYKDGDDELFIRDVEPALRDERYIRVGNRPLLIVYRVDLLPNPRATAEVWRRYCRSAGLGDPFLVAVQSFGSRSPEPFGFDAAIEFPTHNYFCQPVNHLVKSLKPDFNGRLFDYAELVKLALESPSPKFLRFRCVTPAWDNTPRNPITGQAFVEFITGTIWKLAQAGLRGDSCLASARAAVGLYQRLE